MGQRAERKRGKRMERKTLEEEVERNRWLGNREMRSMTCRVIGPMERIDKEG